MVAEHPTRLHEHKQHFSVTAQACENRWGAGKEKGRKRDWCLGRVRIGLRTREKFSPFCRSSPIDCAGTLHRQRKFDNLLTDSYSGDPSILLLAFSNPQGTLRIMEYFVRRRRFHGEPVSKFPASDFAGYPNSHHPHRSRKERCCCRRCMYHHRSTTSLRCNQETRRQDRGRNRQGPHSRSPRSRTRTLARRYRHTRSTFNRETETSRPHHGQGRIQWCAVRSQDYCRYVSTAICSTLSPLSRRTEHDPRSVRRDSLCLWGDRGAVLACVKARPCSFILRIFCNIFF